MTPQEKDNQQASPLLTRTKSFAVRVIRLVDSLPRRRAAGVIGSQLLRSATSIGANYRAARRARSNKEFCAKLGIVEEEADESIYWIELLMDSQIVKSNLLVPLLDEANEIAAMIVASIRTARKINEEETP
jgi:four helix bundle protein